MFKILKSYSTFGLFSYKKWPFKDPSISKFVYLRSLSFIGKKGLLSLWNSSNLKALSCPIRLLSEGTKWRFWFALPAFPTQLLASSTWRSRAFPMTRFTNWTPSLDSLWAHSWRVSGVCEWFWFRVVRLCVESSRPHPCSTTGTVQSRKEKSWQIPAILPSVKKYDLVPSCLT